MYEATSSNPAEVTPLPSSREGTPMPSSREWTPMPSFREGTPIDGTLVQSPGENLTPTSGQTDFEIVDTSKLKSVVWQHMQKIKVGTNYKAVCNYCKVQLSANVASGTRHLTTHIENCVRKRQRVLPKAFQMMLGPKKNSDGKTTVGNFTFDQEAKPPNECSLRLES
jgi:BED zinc finger